MHTKKLKKLNKEKCFTEREIREINKFLVSNYSFIIYDKFYDIDDAISDIFYYYLNYKDLEYDQHIGYYLSGSKINTIQRYKSKMKQKEWVDTQISYSNFFDQVGDLKRLYIYLEKTNQYKLSKLLRCITENIIYGEDYKTDKINVTKICNKMSISRKTFYKHISQLKKIYEGK